MIAIKPEDERETGIWRSLVDLGLLQKQGWTVIGAQMVALHAFEHGKLTPRTSADADVLVNVRVLTEGTQIISKLLRVWDLN